MGNSSKGLFDFGSIVESIVGAAVGAAEKELEEEKKKQSGTSNAKPKETTGKAGSTGKTGSTKTEIGKVDGDASKWAEVEKKEFKRKPTEIQQEFHPTYKVPDTTLQEWDWGETDFEQNEVQLKKEIVPNPESKKGVRPGETFQASRVRLEKEKPRPGKDFSRKASTEWVSRATQKKVLETTNQLLDSQKKILEESKWAEGDSYEALSKSYFDITDSKLQEIGEIGIDEWQKKRDAELDYAYKVQQNGGQAPGQMLSRFPIDTPGSLQAYEEVRKVQEKKAMHNKKIEFFQDKIESLGDRLYNPNSKDQKRINAIGEEAWMQQIMEEMDQLSDQLAKLKRTDFSYEEFAVQHQANRLQWEESAEKIMGELSTQELLDLAEEKLEGAEGGRGGEIARSLLPDDSSKGDSKQKATIEKIKLITNAALGWQVDFDNLDMINERELRTILIASIQGDFDAIQKYIKIIDRDLNARKQEALSKKTTDWADKNKVLGFINYLRAAPGKALSVLGTVEQGVENFMTGRKEPVDPNSWEMTYMHTAEDSKKGVQQDLSPGMKVFSEFVFTGADLLLSWALGPEVALGYGAVDAVSQVQYDMALQNKSPEEAILAGAVVATTEYIKGKLPWDEIANLEPGNTKGFKSILNSVKPYIGQHIFEVAMDSLSDWVKNGDESEIGQYEKELIASGMDANEAHRNAVIKFIAIAPAIDIIAGAFQS